VGGACAGAHLSLDLSGFEEGAVIGEASRLYRRANDGFEIVVEAFDVSQFDSGEVDREIENLSNLRHPLICKTIGFAFSEAEGKLKIGRLHAAGGSLADVVSSKPAWWTPTAKAEAVVGVALALRFAHELGLLHGGLNSWTVLFDGGGRIQIADFRPMRRDGGFSGEVRVRCGSRRRMFRHLRCSSLTSWPGVLRLRRTLQTRTGKGLSLRIFRRLFQR
jgi:hypothetical protein